jgi:multisubunit Na+/H+ antiporter MnhF subunit
MTARGRTTLIFSLVLITAAVLVIVLLVFSQRSTALRIVAVDHMGSYTVENFAKSELQLFDNGTFHIMIIRSHGDEDTTLFVGLGTYTKNNKTTTLTFTEAYDANNDGTFSPVTELSQTCPVTNGRTKFIFAQSQICYFA